MNENITDFGQTIVVAKGTFKVSNCDVLITLHQGPPEAEWDFSVPGVRVEVQGADRPGDSCHVEAQAPGCHSRQQ